MRKLFVFLILILLPVQSFATLYDYNVSGQLNVNNVLENVTGNIVISDVFTTVQQGQFVCSYFQIIDFSLNVTGSAGSFNFSGDTSAAGSGLYWNWSLGSGTGGSQWYLGNGTNRWNNSFDGIVFYTSEMVSYNPIFSEYFGEIAPIISLTAPSRASQFGTISDSGGSIWLTRAAPVPEPCTLLLLGGGLVGVFFIRKKMKS